jgi:hypothetical protein
MIWLAAFVLLVALAAALLYAVAAVQPRRALRRFAAEHTALRKAFFDAASSAGTPRGLRWLALDWTEDVEPLLARDRATGDLVGLVPITVSFEAIVDGPMDGLPAVGLLRNASAVFYYRRGRWTTAGKTLFNLNPDEVLVRYAAQYTAIPLRSVTPVRPTDTP